LAQALGKEFGSDVDVESKADPGTTGRFEVTVDGTLVHSKSKKGQGKCESDSEKKAVIDAVRAKLK
jgi:selT/selW/selH-like putative selenoprotein